MDIIYSQHIPDISLFFFQLPAVTHYTVCPVHQSPHADLEQWILHVNATSEQRTVKFCTLCLILVKSIVSTLFMHS